MDQVNYHDLSLEIKNEIQAYLESHGSIMTVEDATIGWFAEYFDQWLITRFRNGSTRRSHFRLDVEIPMRVVETILETQGEDTGARDIVGSVLNISRGGLYFRSRRSFPIASVIRVDIDLSNIFSELSDVKALGMIMRSEKLDADYYGIGIMFSTVYEDSRSALDSFILKKLSDFIYNQKR